MHEIGGYMKQLRLFLFIIFAFAPSLAAAELLPLGLKLEVGGKTVAETAVLATIDAPLNLTFERKKAGDIYVDVKPVRVGPAEYEIFFALGEEKKRARASWAEESIRVVSGERAVFELEDAGGANEDVRLEFFAGLPMNNKDK